MFNLIIAFVLGLIVLVLLAVFINKIPKKLHPVLIVVLLLVSGFFGYKLYKSIEEPVKFEAAKEERYKEVVAQLILIRDAQKAHKDITGTYTDDINKLARFVDTAQFALTQKRDSTIIDEERNLKFRLRADDPNGYKKEITLIDTLGFQPVKDSFKNVDISSLLKYNSIEGAPGAIEMKTDVVIDKENRVPVFRLVAQKKDILFDQPERLVKDELEAKSVESIDGPTIFVGSLDEITTSGNWPRQYAIDDN
jgi:xanthosine utilization system XapX-like protein